MHHHIFSFGFFYNFIHLFVDLIEFEMEDPNVPNHQMIKLRSKQLVEAQVSEFDVPVAPSRK